MNTEQSSAVQLRWRLYHAVGNSRQHSYAIQQHVIWSFLTPGSCLAVWTIFFCVKDLRWGQRCHWTGAQHYAGHHTEVEISSLWVLPPFLPLSLPSFPPFFLPLSLPSTSCWFHTNYWSYLDKKAHFKVKGDSCWVWFCTIPNSFPWIISHIDRFMIFQTTRENLWVSSEHCIRPQ